MQTLEVFSPAKINLFLAITGRREDGFHDLISVAAQLDLGDTLSFAARPSGFGLTCEGLEMPSDDNNLVLRAARIFAQASGWQGGAHIRLHKQVPIGAGLGGGSSNAAATLQALNELAGEPLAGEELSRLAAQVGSDCPLFLAPGPVIMRGRGERLEPLPPAAMERVCGRRLLVFKPAFGIETAWAYRELAAAEARDGSAYLRPAAAEVRLADWLRRVSAPAEELVFNNMERVAFEKFVALPTLVERLRTRHGCVARMSGSGSACFALLAEQQPADPLIAEIRDAWGETAWCQVARIRSTAVTR